MFEENASNRAGGYATGATIGGISFFVFASLTGGKVVRWTIFGIIAGGFIGYRIGKINSPETKKTEFKNYGEK